MASFWKKFKEGLFTKSQILTGITLTMVTTSTLIYAFNQLSLTTFSSGTAISSAQMNANFEYLKERIDYLAGDMVDVGSNVSPGPYSSACCGASTYQTITFNTIFADFSSSNLGANITGNNGLSVTENGTYEFSIDATMDTTINNMPFSIRPVKKWIDTGTGSTFFSLLGFDLSLYSNSPNGSYSSFVALNSGDLVFMGVSYTGAGTVDLLPGYRFTIKKK